MRKVTLWKKVNDSRPQPGCLLPNSLFPPRESLVSVIPAGDGKIVNLFYSVEYVHMFFVQSCMRKPFLILLRTFQLIHCIFPQSFLTVLSPDQITCSEEHLPSCVHVTYWKSPDFKMRLQYHETIWYLMVMLWNIFEHFIAMGDGYLILFKVNVFRNWQLLFVMQWDNTITTLQYCTYRPHSE
jgi:hypothetical protein